MTLGLALGDVGCVLGRYVSSTRNPVRVRPVQARAARTSPAAKYSSSSPHTEGLRSAGAAGEPSRPLGDEGGRPQGDLARYLHRGRKPFLHRIAPEEGTWRRYRAASVCRDDT